MSSQTLLRTILAGIGSLAILASPGAIHAQSLPEPKIGNEVIGTPELVKAACTEGAVSYYTGQDGNDERQILRDFEKQFPCIKVSVISVGTSQLYERVRTEAQAGRVNGDVMLLSDIALAGKLIDEGMLRRWTAPSDAAYPASGKSDGWWYAASSTLVYPIYNTELVTGEQVPRSWKDLLKPEWKGKFGVGPVNVGGPQWVQYAFMLEVLGEDYLKALVAQQPQIYTTLNPVVLGTARGELLGGIVAHLNDYPVRVRQGAPTAAVYPPEGIPVSYYPMMLLKGAAHPAAGELLANYYLSKVGQGRLVEIRGAYSARADVAPAKGNKPIAELKLWNPGYEKIKQTHAAVIDKTLSLFKP